MIICLTETRVTEDVNDFEIDILGYQLYRVNSENRHTGGVIIYIKKCIDLLKVEQYQLQKNYWFIVLRISIFEKIYLIGNVYRSPSGSCSEFLTFFNNWCENFEDRYPVIIMGDFNINWLVNSTYSSKLKKIANDSGFVQNVNEVTHQTDQGGSLIDLVFTSSKLSILSCQVVQMPRIGDHYMVKTKIGFGPVMKENVTVFTRGKVDYEKINDRLSSITWNFRNNRDINAKYLYFYNTLRGIYDQVAPKIDKVIKPKYKEWYNDRVKNAIKERDNSYKIFKANTSTQNREYYKKCRNEVVKTIREEKENFYQRKIDLSKNNPKRMWETLGQLIKDKNKKTIKKININNEVFTHPTDIAENLNTYFVNSIENIVSNIDKHNTNPNPRMFDQPEELFCSFRLIDSEELHTIVFSLPNKGSPDDINAEFIKKTYHNIKDPLLNLINTSLEIGKLPSLLKVSTIIPIQKVSGSVKAEDFRPINLLATIEKIIERVVYRQLMEYIELNNILIVNQSGFRTGHSCETSVQNILYDWKNWLDDGYVVGAVFLDLQRAFETLDRNILIQKLKNYGIEDNALIWFTDYLDNRKQVTRIDRNLSEEKINNYGVPQGSTLGPLLFLLYINDITTTLQHCSVHLFADDTLIYFYSQNLINLIEVINLELQQMHLWFNNNLLRLNVNKTKFMLIGNSKFQNEYIQSNLKVKIGIDYIDSVDKIKYLGFMIDNALTFKEHTFYIIDKISRNINFFSRVSSSLSEWTKVTIYNTLILPHLVYSATILYTANKNEINRLQKLQNRAMRIILRAKRDTPIADILRKLKWLSIEKFVKYQTMIFIFKIKNGLTPKYLTDKLSTHQDIHSYLTRNRNNFYVPRKNKTCSEKAVYHNGLIQFNALPADLKDQSNLKLFKRNLKEYLMGE